jgi:hypothetical protein
VSDAEEVELQRVEAEPQKLEALNHLPVCPAYQTGMRKRRPSLANASRAAIICLLGDEGEEDIAGD